MTQKETLQDLTRPPSDQSGDQKGRRKIRDSTRALHEGPRWPPEALKTAQEALSRTPRTQTSLHSLRKTCISSTCAVR
eukprot:3663921-Pyramimonas_sp.AAC.1